MIRMLSLFALVLVLQACASPQLHLQAWLDPDVNIEAYQSYEIEAVQDGERFLRINGMLETAFALAMDRKAFSHKSPGNASDIKVRFMANVTHDQELRETNIPTPKGIYTRHNMVAVNEGSLLVNIIDSRTNKVLWKGSTIRDINNLDVSKLTQSRINERVSELIASFPSRN